MRNSTQRNTVRPRYRLLRVILPLFLFVFGCFTPQPEQPVGIDVGAANVAILGSPHRLAPGSEASFLVQVRAPYTNQRWPDAPVEVYLNAPDGESQLVYSGATGPDGLAQVSFPVPEAPTSPEQVLEIVTTIKPQDPASYDPLAGEHRTYQDVYIGRTYNILVSSDKPVYQPGQVIHLRGLALDALDLHAANAQTMTLTVADPQGNKLLQKELATSAYGIASADFPLDSQAPSGDYTITAQMGPTSSTRSVEVKPYTLPRFEVTFHPDQTFYLPGETATGAVEAHYFFGKPVAGGQVTIRGTVDDGTGAVTVVELTGQTDAEGRYTYTFDVPESFVGRLDNRSAEIELEISVEDTANHVETVDDSVTVAEKTLLIEAVPEAGDLRRNLENRVYLDVSYPDGVAARATLTVTDEYSHTYVTTTDPYGQAVITLTSPGTGASPLLVTAADGAGNVVEQPLMLISRGDRSNLASILLRPNRAEYRIGDTMNVDILVAGDVETVYLDIIKDHQTFGMAALPVTVVQAGVPYEGEAPESTEEGLLGTSSRNNFVTTGIAQAAIPVDGSLLGTLELNAYAVDTEGQITRDRRYALVNPAPADVAVTADKEVYRPGETATLDIQVNREGAPLPAAVGVAIVDESVFAIEDQDPGFARTYFLLNRALQEPRYQLHDFVDLESDAPSPYDSTPDSVKYAAADAAQIALSGAFAQVLADEAASASAVAAADHPLTAAPAHPLALAWGNRLYLAAPLIGLALYDGSRKRRQWLVALVVFSLGAFVWSACAAPAAAPAASVPASEEAASAEMPAEAGATTATQGEKPPRLRQFFPETLYWLPELVTDAQGRAQIDVPIADSITTWRASLLVSDQEGNLGSSEIGLRVFQDFFVEPDLPRFLTAGDEIDVPIAVYNYLPEAQTITLDVMPGDWFELRGEPQLVLQAGANEVLAAYLPIRVTQFGVHELQITATGSNTSDAVLRQVEVLPDGQRVTDVSSGRLAASQQVTLPIPANAIPGASRVTVKVYPGTLSQLLAGLEGLLQMPYGCFEQTSSATYPNVLVLDYLQRSGQINPRVQLQAEHLISLGYQRLLTFEVPGEPGGFSLFGDPPAELMLTAYGLLEFSDMSEVAYVDPDLLARVVSFLASRQNGDGSWHANMRYSVDSSVTWDGTLAATAYIAWGLADAGYADGSAVQAAVRYLQANSDQLGRRLPGSGAPPPDDAAILRATVEAAAGVTDPQPSSPLAAPGSGRISNYTLALIANALTAAGADAGPVLDELLARAQRDGSLVYWPAETETYLGAYGMTAHLETTALAAQALLRSGADAAAAQGALDFLVVNRDPAGSFYTTQATIQALKALLLAAEPEDDASATVTISYTQADGSTATQTLSVDASNADVVQQVAFTDVPPGAVLALAVEGERQLQYQVVSDFYLPWAEAMASAAVAVDQPMRIDVTYDRTELEVNDLLGVRAEVELLTPGEAGTVIVDLGIPPGFVPVTEDLQALVDSGQVQRYELTGRQIILYLTNVRSGEVYSFNYRLLARYPLQAQTAPSQVYDYYTPDQRASEPPQRITVTLGTPGN
jgi:hypothetical protein